MKLFIAVAATLIAFTAQANDRKLGNVIAVERQITNIYDKCLSKVSSDTTKDSSFFICSFSFLKSSAETQISKKIVLTYATNDCRVNAEAVNGFLFMTFGKAKGSSNFSTAKNCLAQAIDNSTAVNVNVYTIE